MKANVLSLGLASLLIMPVQRVPRYSLLLKVRSSLRLFVGSYLIDTDQSPTV